MTPGSVNHRQETPKDHPTPSPQGLALGSTSLHGHARSRLSKLMDAKAKPWHDGESWPFQCCSQYYSSSCCGRSSVIVNHGALEPTWICAVGRKLGSSASVPYVTCT